MANAYVSYGVGALVTATFHPLGYAKVLIQLGHEPLAPVESKDFFGRPKVYYPNILKYIKHIKSKDGFFGLYRGLLPRVLGGAVGNVVTVSTQEFLKKKFPQQEEEGDELLQFLKKYAVESTQEATAKCVAILCSQPFQVIAVRSMAQFVGDESEYSSIFSAITEIYRTDGISGFFVGIIPRMLGDVIAIFLINFISELINKYCIEDKEYRSYTSAACSLVVSQFTYPFQLVSTIMTVNKTNLMAASPPNMRPYTDWRECWRQLKIQGQLKRGSTMFWRPCFERFHYVKSTEFRPLYH